MSQLTFTTVQTNLHWEDKAANLQMLEEKIHSIKQATQIVVLPEMFSTGFSMNPALLAEDMNGPTVAWMKRIAAEKKIILTGSVIISDVNTNGQTNYYNRLVWMLPNGQFAVYDKRHRFAYAGEDEHYAAGNKRLIASVNGWKIHLQICYDLRFPVWARQQTSPQTPLQKRGDENTAEYDVLIYVANWPAKRIHAWRSLLVARAIENQCYVIGVNRVGEDGNKFYHSGNSMVVNAMGEILYEKENEEDVHTISLFKQELEEIRTRLPFLKDADDFHISL
jgi:omega-amidase